MHLVLNIIATKRNQYSVTFINWCIGSGGVQGPILAYSLSYWCKHRNPNDQTSAMLKKKKKKKTHTHTHTEQTSYSIAFHHAFFNCSISKTYNIILTNKKISLKFDGRWAPQLHARMLYFWPQKLQYVGSRANTGMVVCWELNPSPHL